MKGRKRPNRISEEVLTGANNETNGSKCRFICVLLHKESCTSAIKASFIAFGLHFLCIRKAAPQQLKQALLRSVCISFAVRK